MGMILGHHIPGRTGAAPAADSCSYSVKSDDPTPEPFSTPGGSRRDVRFRQDGLRAWTHWTVLVGGNDTHQYDISPAWSFLQADWTPNGNITRVQAQNRSMTWHDNGTKLTFLSRWFSSFRRVDTFDHSAAPYDISGGLGPGFAGFTALTGPGEYMARFSLDGFSLFIDTSGTVIRRYIMTTAHDISTITGFDQLFNFGAFVGGTNTWEFSADHARLYFSQSNGLLASLDLTAPDDISAPFNYVTGPDTDLPSNLQVPRGMNIRADTGDIILLGDQNAQRIRCWAGGVAPGTDADFSNVVLLLDFDGPDGSTNITDLSPSGHTETFVGNAQVDTAVRALGQNTMLLDGAGDLLTFPDSNDWDFGTGDFTIEFNIDLDVLSTQTFMGNYLTGSGADKGIVVQIQTGANLRVLRGDDVLASVAWPGAAINTDFHIAVTRSGTDLRIFVDGSELASVTDSSDFSGSVQPWRIGSLDGAAQFVDGNIGAVRVTKGVARYTAPFTVPQCFYPNQGAAPSSIFASGSPMITAVTAAPPGAANVQAAGGLGYIFTGATILRSQGNGNIPPGPYTVAAPGSRSVGDLLVTWVITGGYPGQSNIDLREGDFPIGFQAWSSTGAITIIDIGLGRSVLTIAPRIATGDILDDVVMFGMGPFPFAIQMACFTNAHAGGLGSITADNESTQTVADALLRREDSPSSGFDHLLDVWATGKKSTPVVAGATTSADASEPTIVVLSAIGYSDNGFGDGLSGVFGYRITPSGTPGVAAGNWGMDILESNESYSASARWKSADS